MITKEYISELKQNDNAKLADLVRKQQDIGTINFILESLGQLPSTFDSSFLYDLLEHQHSQVRLNAVKNIGKLNGKSDISKLSDLLKKETDTSVKREIISSIGRQRKPQNKPILFECLNDKDPKIVCQAIRGLLIFEKDKDVEEHLKPLINHTNEIVRAIIYKEYFAKNQQKDDQFSHPETFDFLKNIVVNAVLMDIEKNIKHIKILRYAALFLPHGIR